MSASVCFSVYCLHPYFLNYNVFFQFVYGCAAVRIGANNGDIFLPISGNRAEHHSGFVCQARQDPIHEGLSLGI